MGVIAPTACAVRIPALGRVRTCRIEPRALRTVEQWVAQRRSAWERRLDRLGEVLAQEMTEETEE